MGQNWLVSGRECAKVFQAKKREERRKIRGIGRMYTFCLEELNTVKPRSSSLRNGKKNGDNYGCKSPADDYISGLGKILIQFNSDFCMT